MIPDGYTDLAPGKIASVVTYLEMAERPSPAAAAAGEIRLRQIQNPDLNWYRAIYRRAGAQWFWFSRLEMSDQQLSARLNTPTTELCVAESGDREIGMAELDRSQPSQVEITFFALFPEAMGRGFGRSFMAAVLDRAFADTTKRVWLHTCTLDAPGALAFYMKCGFRPYKRAIEVADDPRLRGILPADTNPHIPIIR